MDLAERLLAAKRDFLVPCVYHFYRQPMSPLAIRQTLVAIFAFNALLRLALVVPMGRFGMQAAWLSLCATPLVLALTWWIQRHPPRWSVLTVRTVVCALLALAGLSLVVPAAANRAAAAVDLERR